MKKVAITLVATLMMFGVSYSVTSKNIESTTNDGKRVLLNENGTWKYIQSKQNKVNEARPDAAVDVMRWVVKFDGKKMSVPYAECYRSKFLSYVNRDPKSFSETSFLSKDRKILEMITVDNLNLLIEVLKKGKEKFEK